MHINELALSLSLSSLPLCKKRDANAAGHWLPRLFFFLQKAGKWGRWPEDAMNCSCLIQKRECSQIFSSSVDYDVQPSTGPPLASGSRCSPDKHLSLSLQNLGWKDGGPFQSSSSNVGHSREDWGRWASSQTRVFNRCRLGKSWNFRIFFFRSV